MPPVHGLVWHDRIEAKTVAYAIIDRITASAHSMVIDCTESLRRHFTDDEQAA